MPEENDEQKSKVSIDVQDDSDSSRPPLPEEVESKVETVDEKIAEFGEPPVTVPIQPKKSRKKLFLIAAVVLLLAVGAAAWFFVIREKPVNKATAPIKAAEQKKPEQPPTLAELDPLLQKFITPTTGETWLANPKPLPKQGYLQADAFYNPDDGTDYYEVGKRGDKTIIMSATQELGDTIYLYEKSADGTITFIARPDSQAVYNEESEQYYSKQFKPVIKINKDIRYDSLSLPKEIAIDKDYRLKKPTYARLGDRDSHYTDSPQANLKDSEVKVLGSSKINRQESAYTDTKLTSISYYLLSPLKTRIGLEIEPLDIEANKYQWSKGANSAVADKYKPITRGCGASGSGAVISRVDGLADTDTVDAGKSGTGLAVHEFKDPNHPVIQKAYDEFKEFVSYDKTIANANISKNDFVSQHAVVLHKDRFGQWLVYVGENMAPVGGCAKPVVYLYPTARTMVNVRVGADVKISDPFYDPRSGWNALANPDGSLVVGGQPYSSLFWEGPGQGSYPSIDSGVIVETRFAVRAIQLQLRQLGLNQQESADFIEYWQDKLPNKPYTRLTWLTTAELEQLAPLHITPKPDTLIRVFLDYSGLDAPYDLPRQELTALPRSGFTVVEWGGLSPYKLY